MTRCPLLHCLLSFREGALFFNQNDEVSGGALSNESYQLSDELDENRRQFVLNSKGGLEFGYITDDTGLKSAPILLSEGIKTNPKTGDNKEVYNRHTTTKQSVETVEASQGAEQSDTQTPSSMNAPTPSEGKDTTNSDTNQGKEEKIEEKVEEQPKDDVVTIQSQKQTKGCWCNSDKSI